jgi:uncharacterized membrane protein
MRRHLAVGLLLLGAVFVLAAASGAGPFSQFTPIDFPAPGSNTTVPNGINARGDIVGTYNDANGQQHGFLRRAAEFTTIDYPGTMDHPGWVTSLYAINNRGDIAGTIQYDPSKPGGDYHGFVLRDGKFETVEFPGHLNTIAAAINDSGEVVGCYHDYDLSTTMHGMIFSHGNYIALDGLYPPLPNEADSMNNGVTGEGDLIDGLWTDMAGATHGYLLRPNTGSFTPFDYPNSIHTEAWGINDFGEAVGFYLDQSSNYHGYVMRHGEFRSIDYPGAAGTLAFGINPEGSVVGMFFDAAGNTHGFLLRRSPRFR